MTITFTVMSRTGQTTVSASISTDKFSVEYQGELIPCTRQRADLEVGGLSVPYVRAKFANGGWLPWASDLGHKAGSLRSIVQEWAA